MANVLKIWWATKFLTRNLMDSSYISHLRDSTPSFFLHPYLIIDRMIVNSVAKVQSGCVKNWHRRRKNEEGRLNWRWNTICILPRKGIWPGHWFLHLHSVRVTYTIYKVIVILLLLLSVLLIRGLCPDRILNSVHNKNKKTSARFVWLHQYTFFAILQ